MKWNGDDKMDEMADEMERERENFYLENIKCQVTLIFTLYFLHKTANPRLVFRLIKVFFFFNSERNKDQADEGEEFFSTSLIAEFSWNTLTKSSFESGL